MRDQDITKHIGRRLFELRHYHGMSQETLEHEIGVSFQQIQKYEVGTNRIASVRLYRMAQILDVEVNYFFEGLSDEEPTNLPPQAVMRLAEHMQAELSPEIFKTLEAFIFSLTDSPKPRTLKGSTRKE